VKRKTLLALGELSARHGPIGLHADGGDELPRNVQTPRHPAPETRSGGGRIRDEISRTVDRSHSAMSRITGPENGSGKRLCQGCGEPFRPRRTDARHCGATCRKRAQRERQA
jgi:hypothetical protein